MFANSHNRPDVLVIGAGALGLAVAARAARSGAVVQVFDPAPEVNASSVAAGMIAPAFEAALEEATANRAALYRRSAALWPAFAAAAGVALAAGGADWLGPAEPLMARMAALGFSPVLRGKVLHAPEDAVIDPVQALRALRRTLEAHGGAMVRERVLSVSGRAVVTPRGRVEAGAVVLATGWSPRGLHAPELNALLAAISPIKGQILTLGGGGLERPTRAPGVYLVPRGAEVIVGATMEPGGADTEVDPSAIERLRVSAVAAVPALGAAPVLRTMAGVRGATADGLPLAGATPVSGVFCALGPRRNGWLLAPLVAEVVFAALRGGAPDADAESLRPERFAAVSSG